MFIILSIVFDGCDKNLSDYEQCCIGNQYGGISESNTIPPLSTREPLSVDSDTYTAVSTIIWEELGGEADLEPYRPYEVLCSIYSPQNSPLYNYMCT